MASSAPGDTAEVIAARCAEPRVMGTGAKSDCLFPSRPSRDSHSSSAERADGPEIQTWILAVPLGALSRGFLIPIVHSHATEISLWGCRVQGGGSGTYSLQTSKSCANIRHGFAPKV